MNTTKRNINATIIILLIGMVLQCASTGTTRITAQEEKELKDGFTVIVNDLIYLVNTTNGVKDKYPAEVIGFTLQKIREREIGVNISLKMDKDIYGGMGFSYSEKGKDFSPTIHISPHMIKLYKTRPSIVLSAFVHESMHAKSFFMDSSSFMASKSNSLENYLYQLDALNCEARFIREYLKDNTKYQLTIFEQFLDKSFYEDNLANFSHSLIGLDMSMAFYLNRIHKMNITHEKKVEIIEKLITDLIEKGFTDKKSDFENFSQMVPMYTVLKFSPISMVYIDRTNGVATNSDHYSYKIQHPEIYEKLIRLEKIFHDNISHYAKYHAKTHEMFKKVD